MAKLPFLVVHGALIWKVLLATLVVTSLGLVAVVRAAWVRLRARLEVRRRTHKVTAIAEGDGCVRGHLRGGSVATLARGQTTRDHVQGAPYLECADGTRVELAATPEVVVGARVATSRLRVPRGTPPPIGDKGGRWVLRRVADGDEVVANGTLERIARADTSHRANVIGWRLVSGELAAIAAKAKSRPAHPVVVVLGIGIALAGWYGELHRIGSSAVERIDRRPDRATMREIAPFGAFAIAAAMPGSRDQAFHEASDSFAWRYHHLGSVVALHDAIDAEIGPCRAAERQLREVRLDASLASAHACGDGAFETYVELFLGSYDKALASPEPGVRERAAIGAGQWRVAAEAAEQQSTYDTKGKYPEFTARARCRAAWYHNLAGVSTAVPTEGDPKCAIYAALAQPPDRRRERLQGIAETERAKPERVRDSRYLELVGALMGAPPADTTDRERDDFYSTPPFGVLAWTIAQLVEPTQASDPLRVSLARIALVRGDFARARQEASAVLSSARRSSLLLTIALREGTAPPPGSLDDKLTDPAAVLRAGRIPVHLHVSALPENCSDDLRRAIANAISGDGAPLAQAFAECRVSYYSTTARLFYAILPQLRRHRAEVADALRVYRDERDTYSADRVPFGLLEHLGEYRDLAQIAGDTEEADRLQAIIARHAQALAYRDRLTAFALLE